MCQGRQNRRVEGGGSQPPPELAVDKLAEGVEPPLPDFERIS